MERQRPFAMSVKRIAKSPFKTVQAVRACLARLRKGDGKIGFTRIASLKAMGLLPRTNGMYMLGPKYRNDG